MKNIARALLSIGLLAAATPAIARQVPIGGVTGTLALQGAVAQEGAAIGTVVVKSKDGVEHLFHLSKDLLVHGGKKSGTDALRGLRKGTPVVVHYTVDGDIESAHEIDQIDEEGLKVTEGVVTRIDRKRREVTVRFDNQTTETFRLTDRAAEDAGKDVDQARGETRITLYYTDENGQKVAHFFRKTG